MKYNWIGTTQMTDAQPGDHALTPDGELLEIVAYHSEEDVYLLKYQGTSLTYAPEELRIFREVKP